MASTHPQPSSGCSTPSALGLDAALSCAVAATLVAILTQNRVFASQNSDILKGFPKEGLQQQLLPCETKRHIKAYCCLLSFGFRMLILQRCCNNNRSHYGAQGHIKANC